MAKHSRLSKSSISVSDGISRLPTGIGLGMMVLRSFQLDGPMPKSIVLAPCERTSPTMRRSRFISRFAWVEKFEPHSERLCPGPESGLAEKKFEGLRCALFHWLRA